MIECKINLNPLIQGDITEAQLKVEVGHFVNDVLKLRDKYSDWLSDLSNDLNWDEQLKDIR